MPNHPVLAVFDSSTLVSAFLNKDGVSDELLQYAKDSAFQLVVSDDILAETLRVLLESRHIRRRYHYADSAATQYVHGLRVLTHIADDIPELHGVVRDPNDDMIVACAVGSKAQYIVARDKDLLDLGEYDSVMIISPEAFISILREMA